MRKQAPSTTPAATAGRSRLGNAKFGEERAGTEDGPYVFLSTRRGAALSAPALRLESHIAKTHYGLRIAHYGTASTLIPSAQTVAFRVKLKM